MRKLRLFILLGFFIGSSQLVKGQVFGYPGATWVFGTQAWWGSCGGGVEKWEYISDTTVLGVTAKNIKVINKWNTFVPPGITTSIYHNYFNVNGDTVSIFIPSDSTWLELYNFSLQAGDTTHSPLRNRFGFGFSCDDTIPYLSPAVVVENGLDTIAGEALRYYKVKYRVGQYMTDDFSDTVYAYQTYYERIIVAQIGYDGWYPTDNYLCGWFSECGDPTFMCYTDTGMTDGSLCSDFTWFETLSIPQEPASTPSIIIHPNPTSNILIVSHDPNATERYSVISSDGKWILTNIYSPLNTSNLPAGVYFITNEARTWYKKFIKS